MQHQKQAVAETAGICSWGRSGDAAYGIEDRHSGLFSRTDNHLTDGPVKLCLASSIASKVSSPPAQVHYAAG